MKTRGQECRRVRAGACVFVVYTVSEKERSSLTTTFKGDTPNTEENKREERNTQQPRHHGLYTLHIESVSCAGDISTNSIAQVMLACKR